MLEVHATVRRRGLFQGQVELVDGASGTVPLPTVLTVRTSSGAGRQRTQDADNTGHRDAPEAETHVALAAALHAHETPALFSLPQPRSGPLTVSLSASIPYTRPEAPRSTLPLLALLGNMPPSSFIPFSGEKVALALAGAFSLSRSALSPTVQW